MRRFTILGLMGLVLGLAVAIAALRNADSHWAGWMIMGTALLIGVATLGAVYHSGRQRASRLGFAVFGGGYFALAFLGLNAQDLASLPTTWLLSYIHQQAAPPQTFALRVMGPGNTTPGTILMTNVSPGPTANTVISSTTSQYIVSNLPGNNASATWKSLLPGAANYEAFSAVGHCLFALLAGLMGMVIARRYQARQVRVQQTEPGGGGINREDSA